MIDSSMEANKPFTIDASHMADLFRLPESAQVNHLFELIQGVTGYG
jgi:hypothetical protein